VRLAGEGPLSLKEAFKDREERTLPMRRLNGVDRAHKAEATVSDVPDTAQELREVLEDLRRHLLWQEEGGRVLQVDARLAAELRGGGIPRPAVMQRAQQTPVQAQAPQAQPRQPQPPFWSPVAREQQEPAARRPLPREAPPPRESRPAPVARPAVPESRMESPQLEESERPTLDQIRRELGDCQRCKLCTGRKNIVFGVGNPRAELVFVGEGPGAEEDVQGVPFVGAAGQLLTKMIEAMGFQRDEVFICNVVKCRPPGNRNPEPDEVKACEPFLREQLKAVEPKAIVALGKFAAQTLLRDGTAITRMRGQWREYEGIRLMPTFHPAYLLRQPAEKRKVWEDLQQVMKLFGKQPGKRG
jgi:uracil-DNA glycosylase family 4